MELPSGKKCHKLALKKNVTNWLSTTNLLNGDNAAELSKKFDIILSGYGRLETNSNTLFFKFIMEKKFKF